MNFQGFCDVTFPVLLFFTKLSESVVNRMKDCSQPSAGEQLAPGLGPECSCSVPVPIVPQPTIPALTVPSPSVCGPAEGTYKAPHGGMLGEWEQKLGEICLATARLAFLLE